MKRCSKCGETKPLDEFWRNRRTKDGRAGWCKPCHAGAVKDWRQRRLAADPEYRRKLHKKRVEHHKRRYASDPEYRARYRDYDRAYRRRKQAEAAE